MDVYEKHRKKFQVSYFTVLCLRKLSICFRKLGIFNSKSSIYNMEVDSEDVLHYSHQKLMGMIETNSAKNPEVVFREYLKNLKFKPIKDFNKGKNIQTSSLMLLCNFTDLEWFNVSEPLSFSKHLKGKVVVLDFFTYCCINCMHIIPELREIENEFSIEDGLVVVSLLL